MNKIVADRRLANTVILYANEPSNFNMRIPDEVRKCVVFFGFEKVSNVGVKTITYGGTGFIVGMASPRIPNTGFLFLVTAKHVVQALQGRDFYIGVNDKKGNAAHFRGTRDFKWFFHPSDNAADVAIAAIGLDMQVCDYLPIPITMCLSEPERKQRGIGTGNEVFITGLFVHYSGQSQNMPIIRTGNIAMIPDGRIPVKGFGNMEAYLIESRSIGGLSGSPIFVPIVQPGTPPQAALYLMGLIQGHWDVGQDYITDAVSSDASGVRAGVNVGIAIATPASKVLEILNSPAIDALMKDAEKNNLDANFTKPD
jgi:hypothetical protein